MKKLVTTIAITGAILACGESSQIPSIAGCHKPRLDDSTVAWFHYPSIGLPADLTEKDEWEWWFMGYATDEIKIICINAPDTCLDTTWFWDEYLEWPQQIICDFDTNSNCIPDILDTKEQ